MIVEGKITLAEVKKGHSKSTGNPYTLGEYVIVLDGGESIPFTVFGAEQLDAWNIQKGDIGSLEIKLQSKAFDSGRRYCNVFPQVWVKKGHTDD